MVQSATFGFTIALLGYGAILARFIPEKFHFLTNTLAAIAAVIFGMRIGLSLEQMGLSLHFVVKGLVVAALISVVIGLCIILVMSFTPLRHVVTNPPVQKTGRVVYETAVRIPLSTALSEEVLFRGVLLAILLQSYGSVTSVAVCSIVFGLWHILPSVRDHVSTAAVPIVITTALAGVFFCWLRLISNSIIAPWLVHWSINASATLAIAFLSRKHDSRH